MNLDELFIKHGTDKSSRHHNYSPNYERHFNALRFNEGLKMLILGVGGYEYPDRGGGDIRAFDEYFKSRKKQIFAVDIFEKTGLKFSDCVKVFQGSQDDGDFLMKVMMELGEPDIIIDDASHMNQLTIRSFKHLFPWVKKGGLYCIEDIESSWWNAHGFDGTPNASDLNHESSINFCRTLINCVNVKHISGNENPELPTHEIESIHFYNNLVIIKKK